RIRYRSSANFTGPYRWRVGYWKMSSQHRGDGISRLAIYSGGLEPLLVRRYMRNALLATFVFILVSAFCPAGWGQNAIANGSISGRVVDSSGGVVSGANVSAKNEETNVAQNGKTNGSGIYNFASLRVGP